MARPCIGSCGRNISVIEFIFLGLGCVMTVGCNCFVFSDSVVGV